MELEIKVLDNFLLLSRNFSNVIPDLSIMALKCLVIRWNQGDFWLIVIILKTFLYYFSDLTVTFAKLN